MSLRNEPYRPPRVSRARRRNIHCCLVSLSGHESQRLTQPLLGVVQLRKAAPPPNVAPARAGTRVPSRSPLSFSIPMPRTNLRHHASERPSRHQRSNTTSPTMPVRSCQALSCLTRRCPPPGFAPCKFTEDHGSGDRSGERVELETASSRTVTPRTEPTIQLQGRIRRSYSCFSAGNQLKRILSAANDANRRIQIAIDVETNTRCAARLTIVPKVPHHPPGSPSTARASAMRDLLKGGGFVACYTRFGDTNLRSFMSISLAPPRARVRLRSCPFPAPARSPVTFHPASPPAPHITGPSPAAFPLYYAAPAKSPPLARLRQPRSDVGGRNSPSAAKNSW